MAEGQSRPVPSPQPENWVVLGNVSGLFGVRGWVKVFSHTSPRTNILNYRTWYLKHNGAWVAYELEDGHAQGKGVVAKLAGCQDRDQAAELLKSEIAVPRDQLPETEDEEYYWSDLQGMRVVTVDGVELGQVDYLFETGANDVMVVKGDRQRLLPFTKDAIKDVDPSERIISVDWDPEF